MLPFPRRPERRLRLVQRIGHPGRSGRASPLSWPFHFCCVLPRSQLFDPTTHRIGSQSTKKFRSPLGSPRAARNAALASSRAIEPPCRSGRVHRRSWAARMTALILYNTTRCDAKHQIRTSKYSKIPIAITRNGCMSNSSTRSTPTREPQGEVPCATSMPPMRGRRSRRRLRNSRSPRRSGTGSLPGVTSYDPRTSPHRLHRRRATAG
jgi:hypothetical protein